MARGFSSRSFIHRLVEPLVLERKFGYPLIGMDTVIQAYRFALDPTPKQQRALASHCGAARFAFNWGLALVEHRIDARQAGREVDVPWTLPTLRREWNLAKAQVAPWWSENSKEAYSSGLDNLARAFKNYWDSSSGRRKGARVGFPRFKKRGRAPDTCRFTTGAIRVEPDRHHVTLPRLGKVRTHESTRKLARRVEQHTARIRSATISRRAQRWFVSFSVEVQRAIPATNGKTSIVGVDVGIRYLAVAAGPGLVAHVEENPRALRDNLRALARAQRAFGRRKAGSKGREESRRQVARVHARIANIRWDALHKLTTRLACSHGTVVVEQLNVAGMLRNRRLARSITDASFGQIRRMLIYKTNWYGSQLHLADRWFASTMTCSACSLVNAKLGLAERTFQCVGCGMVMDRDENAARSLANLVARSGRETLNARGSDVRPGDTGRTEWKREPCAEPTGKSGTALSQGRATEAEAEPTSFCVQPR
jgi:putative transposase